MRIYSALRSLNGKEGYFCILVSVMYNVRRWNPITPLLCCDPLYPGLPPKFILQPDTVGLEAWLGDYIPTHCIWGVYYV